MAPGMIDIESLMAQVQDSITSSNDDAAKVMISAGGFIVVADLSYRIATTKVKITLPEFSEIAPNNLKELFIPFFNLYQLVLENVEIQKGEGLWDWKITCCGMGILAGGIGLLIANHPEWISETIDAAQRVITEAKEFAMKIIEAEAKKGEAADPGLLNSLIPLLVGGATVVPGIPPFP
jgi:hypothetical protein